MSERDCFCGAEDCGECATHQSCDRALADLRDRWENLEAFIVSRTPAGGAGPTADEVLARMDELEGEFAE